MADEIRVNATLEVINGNLKAKLGPGALTFDQATVGGPAPGTIEVGTTEETVDLSEIGTNGWAMFRNLDSTNYVQWGFSTGVYGGRMEPSEPAGPLRLEPGATIYMKANTAACKVQVYVFED